MSNIIAMPRSRKSIIIYANIIRKIGKMTRKYFDVISFIENTCYDLTGLIMEVVEDNGNELAKNEYAKYIPSENWKVCGCSRCKQRLLETS